MRSGNLSPNLSKTFFPTNLASAFFINTSRGVPAKSPFSIIDTLSSTAEISQLSPMPGVSLSKFLNLDISLPPQMMFLSIG